MKKNYSSSNYTGIKKTGAIKILLFAVILFASSVSNNVFAQVVITTPSLTVTATCQFPTPYASLGNIVITETAKSDFATTGGINKTLILNAPTNFSFNPGIGTVSGLSTDITVLSVAVTATKITVTFTAGAVGFFDVVTISGIQIRGNNSPTSASTVKRDGLSTSTINGDITNSVHATLTSIARDPTVAVQPAPQSICEGNNTNFSISTFISPISYQWQEDQGGGFVNLANGTPYNGVNTSALTISGATGSMNGFQYKCIVTGTQDVCVSNVSSLTVNPKPTVITTNQNICSPANADLTSPSVTLGSTPGLTFTYFTNPGATLTHPTPTNSISGTYYIVGMTGSSCSDTTAVIVTVNPKPTVVTNNPAPVCSPETVDLTMPAITMGSTCCLTLSYFIDAGATIPVPNPTAIATGTYYIVGVTSGGGCSDTTAVIVTVNAKPTVITVNQNVCSPANADLTLPSVTAGSTGGLTYSYFTDAGATIVYGTPTTAGAGTYYIVGVTVGGCSDTTAITVNVNPKPNVITTNPTGICAPATADLTLPTVTAGSTVGLTYSYFTDAGATIVYGTPTTAGAGTYYIVGVTVGGCSDTTAITVNVNPKPNVITTNPTGICAPATADLTISAITMGSTPGLIFSYFLNAGATLAIPTPTAVATGTYYIVGVTSGGGCSDTTAVIVTVNPKPTVITVNQNICSPSTADLTLPSVTAGSTGGLTYSYFTDAGATIVYGTPTTAGAGTYYIVGVTSGGGCSDTTAVSVILNQAPTIANAGPDQSSIATCGLTSVSLAANTPINGTGNWSIISGAGGSFLNVTNPTTAFNGTAGASYVLRWTISNNPCVASSDDVSITLNRTPTNSAAGPDQSNTATCGLTSVNLAANTPAFGTGIWTIISGAGGSFVSATNPATVFNGTAGTTYVLRWTISNNPCAASSDDVTITFNTLDNASFSYSLSTYCQSGSNPTPSVTGLPGGTFSSTAGLVFVSITTGQINLASTTLGTYIATYTTNGICPNTATFSLTITSSPSATFSYAGPYCQGGSPNPSPTFLPGSSAGTFSSITGLVFVSTSTGQVNLSSSTAGTYTVTNFIAATGGCPSNSATNTVTINTLPTIAIAGPDQTNASTCGLTSLTLAANTAISGTGIWSIISGAGGSFVNGTNPATLFNGTAGTTYVLRWTISNPPCVASTDDVTITFNSKPTVVTTNPAAVCLPATEDITLPSVTAGSTAGLTFSYFTDAEATLAYNTPTNAITGTYYIVGVLPASGCSDTTAVTVTATPLPTVTANTNADTVCAGVMVTLTGGGTASSYTWTGGVNDAIGFAPGSTQTYTVTGIDGNNCSDTSSITITVNPAPIANAGPDNNLCSGDTVFLSGTGGISYLWTDGTNSYTTSTILASPTASTSYTLTVTDNSGCNASDIASVSVTAGKDLYGHVDFSGGNIVNGNVVIYRHKPVQTQFDTTQVAALDSLGNYHFTGINPKNYLIKVFADTIAYPTVIPTYYGNAFRWNGSAVLIVHHDCTVSDTLNTITLIELTGTGGGNGIIKGKIIKGNGFERIEGEPIPGVDVKLGKNPGGSVTATTSTDETGDYTFSGVANGNYTIYVDIPGLGCDSSYTITIDSINNQFLNQNYTADSSMIFITPYSGLGINSSTASAENKFNVYPNPLIGNTTIEYSILQMTEVKTSLEVYNLLGVKISTLVNAVQQVGTYKYNFNPQNYQLNSGVYFITLTIDGKTKTKRIVVME